VVSNHGVLLGKKNLFQKKATADLLLTDKRFTMDGKNNVRNREHSDLFITFRKY